MATDTTTSPSKTDATHAAHGNNTHEAPATQKVTKTHHNDSKSLKDQQQSLEFNIKDVVPGTNIRTGALPDISGLVETIKKVGVIEPLIGTAADNGKVNLVAGYRRYFAAKQAGLKTVPVRLISAEEVQSLDIALIENLQRADLNPMDKAAGMKKMIDDGADQKAVAARLGVSPGFVSQHLGLFNLPKKAQDRVSKGKIDLTQARELMRIKDADTVEELLDEAQELTASDLKNKVDFLLDKARAKAAEEKTTTPRKKSAKEGEEAPPKKSLAERYADEELAPLKKTDLREQLQTYANKLDRAESENKRLEYKFILKGLEIAAGLK